MVIPSLWVEIRHHAVACGITSLGWGSYGLVEMEERECGWLERQRVLRHTRAS